MGRTADTDSKPVVLVIATVFGVRAAEPAPNTN